MTIDTSIFGLRFGSNVSLQPSQDELRLFLGSRIKDDGRETHGGVLAMYSDVLERVQAFRRGHLTAAHTRLDREKMFYGALSHSLYYNPALKSAVEHYKYQLHALRSVGIRKHTAFINAAAQEIRLLGSSTKAGADKIVKLQEMVEERKKLVETLTSRRQELVRELGHIALYIGDNLFKVSNRCETSIAVLVDGSISRLKVDQLIEDVRMHRQEQLEYEQRDGLDTGQRPENVQQDIALLSREISDNFRDTAFALTQLFESIYDHTLKSAREVDALLVEYGGTKHKSYADEVDLFTRIGQVLDSLMVRGRFELKAAAIENETTRKDIFLEKRKEMLDHLYVLMQKDRRSWLRRTRERRRRSDDGSYSSPGQRSQSDRRAGHDRRKELSVSA